SSEMTTFGDLAPIQMPFDAHPVIQSLQRKVDVLIDLEFDNRQPAVTVNSEQIDDSAIAARELCYLTVDRLGAQRRIQRFQIGTHPRFEPRFGLSWTRRAGLFSAGIQSGVEVSVIPRVNQLLIPGTI